MKKLLKPATIGFYILMLLVCFVVGLFVAGVLGAGKNQGLAGGAIVVGYGVLFGGLGFIASFFIVSAIAIKTIIKINWILLITLILTFGFTYYKFSQRDKKQKEENKKFKAEPTTPTQKSEPITMAILYESKISKSYKTKHKNEKNEMNMGFFAPNYYENPILYFYGNINLEKSLMDHTAYDSITFKRNKYNQFDIATAPPWLVPIHQKLDYDILYLSLVSVSEDFVEVIVNKTNGKTAYFDKRAGRIIYWPEFLLSMHSVEFPRDLELKPTSKQEKIRVRAFEASGEVNTPHQFMRAIQIKGEWMQVLLLDTNFKTVGKGWIQWKRNGKLLVTYNLLS